LVRLLAALFDWVALGPHLNRVGDELSSGGCWNSGPKREQIGRGDFRCGSPADRRVCVVAHWARWLCSLLAMCALPKP